MTKRIRHIVGVLLLAGTTTAFGQQAILHYSFDTDFTDSSGQGNHGALVDLDTPGNAGIVSTAAVFGAGGFLMGDNHDRVDFTTPFQPTNGQAWTVAFWDTLSGGAAGPAFTLSSPLSTFVMRADVFNGVFVTITNQAEVSWPVFLGQGSLHHYALVANPTGIDLDGVPGDDKLALYVDGVLLTPATNVTAYATDLTFDEFGDAGGPFPEGARGRADELWIFNGALNSSQVAGLYYNNGIVIHVDRNAVGASNGTSWADAFTSLQDALAVADVSREIWVAAGAYYPDRAGGADTGSRTTPFALRDGVNVYGGFDGTESSRDARAPQLNVTVLSGDVDENDVNTDGNFIAEHVTDILDENAYTVVSATGLALGVVLDGFTITAAKADAGAPSGGPEQNGGGIFVRNSRLTLTNCTFIGNYVVDDGAAFGQPDFADNSHVTIARCRFVNNVAQSAGGAIEMEAGVYLAILDSEFRGNRAVDVGAGAARAEPDEFFARNSVFSGNACGTLGGALALSVPTGRLVNCTFSGNRAGGNGGGLNLGGSVTLDNCIVHNNRDGSGSNTSTSSVARQGSSAVLYRHCLLANAGGSGPGWNTNAGIDGGGNIDLDPQFLAAVDPLDAPHEEGNFRLAMRSSANNAGDNALQDAAVDLDGNARVFAGVVDQGAYETIDDLSDADGDGLTDFQETAVYQSDPDLVDTDGDTMGDYGEAIAGTDPTDSASYFAFTASGGGGDGLVLTWSSAVDRLYHLSSRTDLVFGVASEIDDEIGATPPVNTYTTAPPTEERLHLLLRVSDPAF